MCGYNPDRVNNKDKKKKNKPQKTLMKNINKNQIVLNSSDLRFPVRQTEGNNNHVFGNLDQD